MMMRTLCLLALSIGVSCHPSKEVVAPAEVSWSLLEPAHQSGWQAAGIPDEGSVRVESSELTLSAGKPMTGAVFTAWDTLGLPGTQYAIRYEAMRLEGEDIFGMCTFPVSSHHAHATFVIGGWGGVVTGISSLDYKDASENMTRAEQRFESGRWYRVRIEVRPEDVRVWVNDRPVVNASLKGKHVSLRPGDIDRCVPFGFATWATTAKVRAVVVERLRP
jgi:hypothetical protein